MIRIGIVDDEKQERDQLKQALARFGAENGTELNVQEFDCAAVYLAAQDRDFDILYLDIDMPQMSGMELAEKIRETDQDVILIFCTNLQQFALNGYSVGALGFIVKPIQWYSFHMYLTRALKVLQKRAGQKTAPPHIVVKDGTVTRLLDAAEIAYVEVRQHDLLYNLCGGDGKTEIIKNRGSMQEIAAQLTPYGFVRCSASYLVNLRCITAVSRMNVYIGGAALPIGRTYKDAFTEAFSRYMAKKEWEDPCRHKLDTEPASPAGYDSMRLSVCPVGAAPQLLRSAAGGGCMGLSRADGHPGISAALGKIAAVYDAAVWSDMVQL